MSTTARDHGFRGDENLYGLGIRIGYYLLWAAVILSGQLGSKYVVRMQSAFKVYELQANIPTSFVLCVPSVSSK